MPSPLRLRPSPQARETLPSFLSRIAAMNGVDPIEFCLDMGFSFKRLLALEERALCDFSECSGLIEDQLEELLSWTGQAIGNVQLKFRSETFGSRSLRNPVVRGCPKCLCEDMNNNFGTPLKHMVMRGDWQFREVSICVKHHHPLVKLWKSSAPTDRYNISARLSDILPDLQDSKFDQLCVQPTAYDLWLDQRLTTGKDDTWLADKSIYSVTSFCRLLGVELLRLEPQRDLEADAALRLAQAQGFEVARQGEVAIVSRLETLASLAVGHNDEPQKAFGKLYVDLSYLYLEKEEFAPFRQILKDCIVKIWPIAAGQEVLGIPQTQRTLHTIHSAAKETGISPFLLEQFLTHAGAIDVDDDRPIGRQTFNASAYASLLAEIPTLVGPTKIARVMGATRTHLKSLEVDGVLTPRIDLPTIKSPWRVEDGVSLVDELNSLAIDIGSSQGYWEGIQQAKKRTSLSVGSIIAAVRDGQLKLGRSTDAVGYAGFRVLIAQIDQMNVRTSKKN